MLQDSAKNLAKDVFKAVHPAAENVEVSRMMGRWYQVNIIKSSCVLFIDKILI